MDKIRENENLRICNSPAMAKSLAVTGFAPHPRLKSPDIKRLLVAVIAGSIAFSTGAAVQAAEGSVPVPVLDGKHSSGETVPGTEHLYPESEYTLTEVTPADTENLAPNVIKYSDPNNLTEGVHYYEIGLKNTEIGTGDSVKYYAWAKDANGVKLVETADSSQAVLTLRYDSGNPVTQIVVPSGETLDLVSEIYVAQDIKNIISSRGVINDISSTFKGNRIEVKSEDDYAYSAIISEYNAQIKNINSSFIGNEVDATSDNLSTVYGTLVKALSKIDNVTSEFAGNKVTSNSARINGGMLEVATEGNIQKLNSDFLLNRVENVSGDVEGSVIANDGTVVSIDSSKFAGNYGVSESGSVLGGAIWNNREIGEITGSVFAGNYAQSSTGSAKGGAIYNINTIGNIENTIFTDNYASSGSGEAQGGAIYTDSDLKISAADGKLTEFTGNYVENGGEKENQAIYVASDNAEITLEATGGGHVLMNDVIDGVEGYKLLLGGDGSGVISLYNRIHNADVVALNGAGIDFADGNFLDYNFLSLNSDEGADYSIDVNFANGLSDTLVLGAGSSGTIYIDDINLLGNTPVSSTIIQVLTASDSISIGLTQNAIDKFYKVTQEDTFVENDTVNATSYWDTVYQAHTMQNVTTEGIRTAIKDKDRTTADSIEYYVEHSTEEIGTESLGDTLKLLTQDLTGNRVFKSEKSDELYTMTENAGVVNTGSVRVEGARNSETGALSTIDAGGHSMLEVSDEGASAEYKNVKITNTDIADGSVLNISGAEGSATLYDYIEIDTAEGINGIVNNGTLTLNNNAYVASNTGIAGDGTLNLNGGSALNLTGGASIEQNTINIMGNVTLDTGDVTAFDINMTNGNLTLGDEGVLTANLLDVTSGKVYVTADNLHADVNLHHSWRVNDAALYLDSGTLTSDISGERGILHITGNVINDALISVSNVWLDTENATLTTNADNLQSIVERFATGSSLNLTGGTVTNTIDGKTNITGDVILGEGAYAGGQWSIAEGASLTGNADSVQSYNGIANSGTINLTGGTFGYNHSVHGGTINILGDTSVYSSFSTDKLTVAENVKLTIEPYMLASSTIINDGIIRFSSNTIFSSDDNPVTGSGYIEIASTGVTFADGVLVQQEVKVLEGATLTARMADAFGDDVTVDKGGTLYLNDNGSGLSTLSQTVSGGGKVSFGGSNITISDTGYVDVDEGIDVTGRLTTNAEKIASDVNVTGTINLTGGTIDGYSISGTGNTRIDTDCDVISNEIIASTNLQLYDRSTLTIDADNILSTTVTMNAGSNLILGDGTVDYDINGGASDRKVSIAGNVKTTDRRIRPAVEILEGGVLTSDIDLLRNNVTNNGDLYLTGNLGKKIAGTGTTHITGTGLAFSSQNASIDGTLDLNNNILSLADDNNAIRTYNINKLTGEGDFALDVNLSASQKSDKINITDTTSDGILNITSINHLNMPTPDELTDYGVIQILYGGSGAQLALDEAMRNFAVDVYREHEDSAKADVFFDDAYNRYFQNGVVTGNIALATTVSTNDSIHVSDVITQWAEEQVLEGNLLAAWNRLSSEDEKFFRFKTADDVYTVPDDSESSLIALPGDLGTTASGTLNIVGVAAETAEGEPEQKSVIDMNGASGFNMTNANTKLNISDVTVENARTSVIWSTQTTNTIGTIDEEGHVSGGIVNVDFLNNSRTESTTSNIDTGMLYFTNGTISQIIDSAFKGNSMELANTDTLYSNPYAIGSTIFLHNTDIGSALTGEGGIINSVFEGNSVTLKGSNSYAFASVLFANSGSYISNIKDSLFKDNTTVSEDGYARGNVVIGGSSTVHNIENTQFINNSVTGYSGESRGGAVYVSQSVIDTIKDCLFEDNSIFNTANNAYYGGAIFALDSIIGEIDHTVFKNNTAYDGGALYFDGNSSATLMNIKDSEFIDNTAGRVAGAARLQDSKFDNIINTDFLNNRVVFDAGTNTENSAGALLLANSSTTVNNMSGLTFENNGITSNSTGAKYGGGFYNYSGTITSLTDSTFTGNYIESAAGYSCGGAFSTRSGKIGTMSGLTFDSNYSKGGEAAGGAIHIWSGTTGSLTDSVFTKNYTESSTGASHGGALYLSSATIEDKLDNLTFEKNYTKSNANNGHGGAVGMNGGKIENFTNSTFTGNYAEGNSAYGGALRTERTTINNIEGLEFNDNYAKANNGTIYGGAMYAYNGTIKNFKDVTFTNNHGEATGVSYGGALHVREGQVIENFENVTFENNYALSTNNEAQGGALYILGNNISNGIVNSSFINNYVDGKSTSSHGGAIVVGNNSLAIIAKDNGLSEFTGNYRIIGGDETTKENEAIYVWADNLTLTLNANTGGTILMNDIIRGRTGTQTAALTGDSTGVIKLFNHIDNMKVSADNVNIETADGKTFDYDFNKLTSDDTAKFNIDFDRTNAAADNFTVGADSSGILYIDSLNVLGSSDENKTIQILKAKDDKIQLALNGENIHLEQDLILNLGDTVYNDAIYHQNEGYTLATTATTNDSITYLAEKTYDGLDLITKSTLNEIRNFIFNNTSNYLAAADISDAAAGTLNITGIEGETLPLIDFNGHKAFTLTNESTLNITDTQLANAKDNTVINIQNENAQVNIDNAKINGNITASGSQSININGNADFAGTIQGAQVVLNDGTVSMKQNTFQNTNSFTANAGHINLANDITGENYIFSDLTSAADTGYIIDLDVENKLSDTITVQNGSGIITIDEVNYLNTPGDRQEFTLKILDTPDDSIQLAIAEDLENLFYQEISRVESDKIQENTGFSHIYYDRERKGELQSQITLATTTTTNDSINFSLQEVWEDSTTIVNPTGDTLKLVAGAENIDNKTFLSTNAQDVYEVTDDIGRIAQGEFTIRGARQDDNISSVNFNNHQGLEVGENSDLMIKDVRLSGTENIINVTDSTGTVYLDGAYINGNITGSEKYELTIDSTNTTTINGSVENANTTLSKGGLVFGENTFSADNTTLNANAGYISFDNGVIENYNINNLQSTDRTTYSLDIDLENRVADNITVGGDSSGPIVLSEFNVTGLLSDIDINDEYYIKILNAENDNTYLSLSETITSQLTQGDILLGKDNVIVSTDEIQAHSKWTDTYNVLTQEIGIMGRLALNEMDTYNDSLKLYHLSKVLGETSESLGDTLRLVNELENIDRSFSFDTANDKYVVQDNLGTSAAGSFEVAGVAGVDAEGNNISSVIDMNSKTGFVLNNPDTELTISNITFDNLNYRDGSLINIKNADAVANLNNVNIKETNSSNAITNEGTLNMTGGEIILNTGIAGEGVTNVKGNSDVQITDGTQIKQNQINVEEGSVTVGEGSTLNADLAIAEKGSVTTATSGITTDVANDGNITFTGGTLSYNISGGGTTNITGEVVNNAQIENSIDVKSGKFTTSADNIGGNINNDASLILDGTLSKNVTGVGTTTANQTLNLTNGAGFEGTLDMNDAAISTADSTTADYNIGTMQNYGSFTIDMDFADNSADKFITGNTSSGTVYIDSINFANLDQISDSSTFQILDTNGTDTLQLALNDAISSQDFVLGRISRDEQDTVQAVTSYTDIYKTYERGGDVHGSLALGQTSTENDSIVVSKGETVWDENRTETGTLGDTLVLWNQLETEQDKEFNFDKAETYTATADVGNSNGTNLTINGVSQSETAKSTINLDNHGGFVLDDASNLTVNNTKLTGNETLISVSNAGANINLNDAYIDGNIEGSQKYDVVIDGNDVTTLNGNFKNASTTLNGGSLKFNADTFADSTNKLTAQAGNINLSDNAMTEYRINELDSNANAGYTLDIDFLNKTSDKIAAGENSTGTVTLTDLNIINEFKQDYVSEDYKIQILDVPSASALQLALSKELEDKLAATEYLVKTEIQSADTEIKAVNNWDYKYYQTDTTINYYGKLGLATTNTTNDSIGINITRTESSSAQGDSMGDTLALMNRLETTEERQLNFDASSNIYEVSENLGQTTAGTISINGVSSADGSEKSTVDLNGYTGFELANDTDLNLNDVKFTGNDTLISVSNENAAVNIKDSYIDGNIEGSQKYDVVIDGNDVTTLNGNITNADSTLNGGGLKFNTTTFANSADTLTANAGNIYLDNDSTENYTVNELTSNSEVKYSLDIDLTNKTSDKLTLVSDKSSGTVFVDDINFLNNETPSEEFTMQILDARNNSIQLALSDALKNQSYDIGDDVKTWDDLKADIYFDENFHDFTQTGTKYGKLNTATSQTENDSIALTYDETIWNEATSVARTDTLKELNVYETEDEKNFNFRDANNNYTVKEDLGTTTAGTLNINGVSESETQKSTINLDNHGGFELANDTTLNINDTKLTGNDNALITVSNANAEINLTNADIDGNITGSANYNIQISGEETDVTTLGGQITNADTTMTSGTLKFETGTFADTTDTLDVQGGTVALDDGAINNYEINDLTSSADASYALDVDLTNKLADTIKVTTSGKGTITLDNLNISGSVENPSEEYKIQILDTPTSDLQLALSEKLQGELDDEYLIGSRTDVTYDIVKEVTNWKDNYNKYSQLVETFGKLGLATTDTTNDSIGITVSRVEEGEIQTGSMGDTLRVVNNSDDEANKTFEFDTAQDEYTVSENLGQTSGTVNVAGVTDGEISSTIDMNGHSGFELVQGSGLNITNTEVKNANASQGSVINSADAGASITLTNTSLIDNTATGNQGGAIYANSDVTIVSDNGNTIIKGNKTANDDEAIYLTGTSKLTLNTVNNGHTQIFDKINGGNGYQVAIDGDESGSVSLNNQIKNANVTMDKVTLNLSGNNHFETSNFTINSGTLNLVNDKVQQQTAQSFTVNGSFNLNADVDLKNSEMDRLPENTTISPDAFINVDKLNLISDTTASKVEIPFAYAGFKDNVQYIGAAELSKDTQVTTLFAPIYKYSLEYENRDDLGYFVFTKGGGSSPSSSAAFNPAILASPVAAQAGGFAAMNETFNYAFKHSDLFSMIPASQRLSAQNGNRYALNTYGASPYQSAMKDNSIWVQPYANFESIGLDNGPDVDVISYGTLVGGDSEYMPLRNGWGTVTTAYVGYHGSNQNFSHVSTNQNGGVLGATQTFYKGNFFTALTASAGASVGDTNTMYGNEYFTMLMSGVASKTGYNFEFKEGKYIIQPSMLMSYTFVNTFDYTNAAGVRIESDPLHTLQLHPTIKFAANLENGWQPYAFVGMVWNLMNDTKFTANNIVLPEMSIKPYVEYGLGVQKTWGEKLTGYLQTMIRNGGRNGVALSFGFRWALGKDGKPVQKLYTPQNGKIIVNSTTNQQTDSGANNTAGRKIIKQITPEQKAKLSIHRYYEQNNSSLTYNNEQ